MVTVGGCNDCHTPKKIGPNGPEPDMTKELSGNPATDRLAPVPAGLRRSMRMPQAPEARKPMLGRLRRELQIWYWRRAAGNGQDKSHARD